MPLLDLVELFDLALDEGVDFTGAATVSVDPLLSTMLVLAVPALAAAAAVEVGMYRIIPHCCSICSRLLVTQ